MERQGLWLHWAPSLSICERIQHRSQLHWFPCQGCRNPIVSKAIDNQVVQSIAPLHAHPCPANGRSGEELWHFRHLNSMPARNDQSTLTTFLTACSIKPAGFLRSVALALALDAHNSYHFAWTKGSAGSKDICRMLTPLLWRSAGPYNSRSLHLAEIGHGCKPCGNNESWRFVGP